jgi:hypothetical protein
VQQGHLRQRSVDLPSVVATVGPKEFEPGEALTPLVATRFARTA